MENPLSFRPRRVSEALRWQRIQKLVHKERKTLICIYGEPVVDLKVKKITALRKTCNEMVCGKRAKNESRLIINKIKEGKTYEAYC